MYKQYITFDPHRIKQNCIVNTNLPWTQLLYIHRERDTHNSCYQNKMTVHPFSLDRAQKFSEIFMPQLLSLTFFHWHNIAIETAIIHSCKVCVITMYYPAQWVQSIPRQGDCICIHPPSLHLWPAFVLLRAYTMLKESIVITDVCWQDLVFMYALIFIFTL